MLQYMTNSFVGQRTLTSTIQVKKLGLPVRLTGSDWSISLPVEPLPALLVYCIKTAATIVCQLTV